MIGVLVMAYGGPNTLEDVEPYLLDVRGYRPTSQEIIEEVRERYNEIGGRSPILELTNAQAAALEKQLNTEEEKFKVFVGMRHWHPFIREALADITAAGIQKVVGLVMAPHYSKMSIGAYYKSIQDAEADVEIAPIQSWNLLPGYINALADRVKTALDRFPEEIRSEVPIIFTAHSLPERIKEWNDPYPEELKSTVQELSKKIDSNPYEFAYQSAAISKEPWLGPDAGDVIQRLAAEGHRHILIAPIGFVCEHVEILYDIDIVYKNQADDLGVHLERIEMLNTYPLMIEGLAELVRNLAKENQWL